MWTWTSKLKTLLFTSGALVIAASIMIFPKAASDASLRGLETWWTVVFPSLLPFFIISELLIGFGIVKVLGAIFEPFMRPLFRVPGSGGFVWAMGMASGYPAGAKLTARLRQENQLTRVEAERLVAFSNFSNPLFMFAVVAAGFYGSKELGLLLAICHYLGNFCVGLVMRYYGHDRMDRVEIKKKRRPSIRKAFHVLHRERMRDNRPLGRLLGDAVHSSVSTLMMIGGFIILFSVIIKVLSILRVTNGASLIFAAILTQLHIPPQLSQALVSGLFEITLGSQTASQLQSPLVFKIVITSFILAFNGFSVQAQVASILADTDISFKPYFIARLLQGIFAAGFTLLLWKPLYLNRIHGTRQGAINVYDPNLAHSWGEWVWQFLLHYGAVITFAAILVFMAITFSSMKKKFPV
ncbi:MAG TPA: sporulation integral membrane protein YlbJ [Bacillales bacterium]|nr:sporulation integral membrane protein YlbJ [Bacillales bacterium]